MTDAENIDWDVCPECGRKGLEFQERNEYPYSFYLKCKSCGWEEGE